MEAQKTGVPGDFISIPGTQEKVSFIFLFNYIYFQIRYVSHVIAVSLFTIPTQVVAYIYD
jgi:hypothetical protein